jgi:hypothetical protein
MKLIELIGKEADELKEAIRVYRNYYTTRSSLFEGLISPKQHRLMQFAMHNTAEQIIIPLKLYVDIPIILERLRQYRLASLKVKLNYLMQHELDSDAVQFLNDDEKQAIISLIHDHSKELQRKNALPNDRKQFFDLVQAFLS